MFSSDIGPQPALIELQVGFPVGFRCRRLPQEFQSLSKMPMDIWVLGMSFQNNLKRVDGHSMEWSWDELFWLTGSHFEVPLTVIRDLKQFGNAFHCP